MPYFLSIVIIVMCIFVIQLSTVVEAQDEIVIDTSRSYQEAIEDAVNAVLPCNEISVTQGRKSVWTVFKDSESDRKVYIDFDNSVTTGKPLVVECEKPLSISPPNPPVVEPPVDPPLPTDDLFTVIITWQAPVERVNGDQDREPVIIDEYLLTINGSRFSVPGNQLRYQIQLSPAVYSVALVATDTLGYSSNAAEMTFTVGAQ